MKDSDDPTMKSGLKHLAHAAAEASSALDIAAWIRSMGVVGVIAYMVYVNNERQWDMLEAQRQEIRAADQNAAERSAKAWAEVKLLREAVEDISKRMK